MSKLTNLGGAMAFPGSTKSNPNIPDTIYAGVLDDKSDIRHLIGKPGENAQVPTIEYAGIQKGTILIERMGLLGSHYVVRVTIRNRGPILDLDHPSTTFTRVDVGL